MVIFVMRINQIWTLVGMKVGPGTAEYFKVFFIRCDVEGNSFLTISKL